MAKTNKLKVLDLMTEIEEQIEEFADVVRDEIDTNSPSDMEWLDALCGRLEAMRDTLNDF